MRLRVCGCVCDFLLPELIPRLTVLRFLPNTGLEGFYPFVPVIFTMTAAEHYHVPLLISPYGFSTYRGS